MKPSKLDKAQMIKIFKACAYLAVSAFIAGIIAQIQDNPDLFGVLTPIINIVLVTIKQIFTPITNS
jgi:hypothetical protein